MKKYNIAIIFAGLLLPLLANGIGAAIFGIPFVFRNVDLSGIICFYAFHFVAIAVAVALFNAAKQFGRILRWLPPMTGYAFLIWFYLDFDISADPQSGIGLLFAPFFAAFCSLLGFVATVILSIIVGIVTRTREQRKRNSA